MIESPFSEGLGDEPAGTSDVNATGTVPHLLEDTTVLAGDNNEKIIRAQESNLQQEPYSVFSLGDKWLIVSMSAIASMFRFALKSLRTCTVRLSYSNAIARSRQTFTSPLSLPWLTISINRQNSLT